MADFDSSDYSSYTGNTQYDPEADTSKDYGDTSGFFDKLGTGLQSLFSGTSGAGDWGKLAAFLGLSGLANRSSYFNAPTTRVGYQGTIPAYSYVRQQTPIAQQRPAGYRPGQGGVSYFTPGYYKDLGVEPKKGQEFLAAMASMLPPGTTPASDTTPAENTTNQMAGGGMAYADGGFTNEQVYNTYQSLLGQGLSHDQILAAAERNPNLNLNAGQINTALAQFQAPKFTDQQLLDAGRTALQQGLDPQTALQKAADFGASQDQLNRLTGALGSSGIAGLTTPTTTLSYNAPPSDYANAYTQYDNRQNTNRAQDIIDSGMGTFANKANITTQDILETGRSLLQQGVNPQDVLNQLAKNPGVTQETLNRAADALGASGYTGLLTPMTKFTGSPSGALTGGISTLQADDKKTTMPVETRADADAGIVSLPSSTFRNELLSTFTKGQQTGNYGDFQSLLRTGKVSAADIAAVFPQLSEQNVLDFAKQHNLSLSKPTRANLAAMLQDPQGELPSVLNLIKQLSGSDYEKVMADPNVSRTMREGLATDYKQILLGGFGAAQKTGDFTKFNKMLADRDISETELRTLFPNITNAAIDEFKKRGLKFNALPDWIEKQDTFKDQSLADRIATKWQQEYGRDISPDELKQISYGIGSMKSQTDAETAIKNIKATPLTQSQEFLDAQKRKETFRPSMLTLREAGLLDLMGGFEGGLPAQYDWNAIANSKDPRGAMMASNRQLLTMAGEDLAARFPGTVKILGRVDGIPILEITDDRGRKNISVGSKQNINEQRGLTKLIYQLGLSSDEINKMADIADKGSVPYQPGSIYKGSDAGLNLRDIAAGGYGTASNPTQDPNLALKGPSAVESANQFAWLAEQLGLARNPTLTSRTGLMTTVPSASQVKYRPGEKVISPTLPKIGLLKRPGGAAGGLGSIIRGKRGYAMGGGIEMLAKGRYLKGDGDGVSDSIPAQFAGSGQPAALADGEFVVPARVVSELGNGSSDAGARKLYAMLDRVEQRARKAKRGKPSGADRELKKLA